MQSFRQYYRFKRELRSQYERDRYKVHELAGCSEIPCQSSSVSGARGVQDLHRLRSPDVRSSSSHNTGSETGSVPAKEDEKGESPNTENDASEETQDLNRSPTQNTTDSQTPVARVGTALGQVLTGVKVQETSVDETEQSRKVFVVGFRGEDDGMNPHNWSNRRRWFATINVTLIGWIVGFASSIDSSALEKAAAEFGVSRVTESLATGLFLVGFGMGALVAGPFSEEFGRNPVYIATLALYMIFIMASGLAPNIGSQLVFRFLAGVFASTPLTCAGGSVSDLWDPLERVYTFPIFANAAFMGPVLGPVVGGFIAESYLSWRWCDWVTLIASGGVLALVFFFQPETYPPILLKWKASHLRELTGDDRYVSHAEIRRESFGHRILHAVYRPILLIVREPIVLLFGLYLTMIYIVLFGFLNGFTFVFTDNYKLSPGLSGACFLGIVIGLCLASALIPFIRHRYLQELQHRKQTHVEEGKDKEEDAYPPPESRLWFAMLGAPALPLSLFWMGWTAHPDVPIWAPLGATVLFGYSVLCIFISCYQYLIDSYGLYAASALASVTVIRYVAAGGMVEVAIPLYGNLGVNWASTLLGCLSLCITPIPYLFYWYGEKIRGRSKFTAP